MISAPAPDDQPGGSVIMPGDSAISIQGLSILYHKPFAKPVQAVVDLSLAVEPGEIVGFIGPNGAGKTSTIKALMGFIQPSGGEIRVFGHPAGSVAAKRLTGFLPEVALYYPFLTAREMLRMFGQVQGLSGHALEDEVGELLHAVRIGERADARLSTFSKGMLQRVGIAQSLLGRPPLMVLDEVTSGLDPVGRRDLRRILFDRRNEGATIFFSSHELAEVAMLCDRIILVDHGSVVAQHRLGPLLEQLNNYWIKVRHRGDVSHLPFICRKLEDGALRIDFPDRESQLAAVAALREGQAEILDIGSGAATLEDYFLSVVSREAA
jgi:ABC-2 type transport system ATP-binding protein